MHINITAHVEPPTAKKDVGTQTSPEKDTKDAGTQTYTEEFVEDEGVYRSYLHRNQTNDENAPEASSGSVKKNRKRKHSDAFEQESETKKKKGRSTNTLLERHLEMIFNSDTVTKYIKKFNPEKVFMRGIPYLTDVRDLNEERMMNIELLQKRFTPSNRKQNAIYMDKVLKIKEKFPGLKV
uniref:Uncharacterized protein n=1 Tax=Panagrolaimus davidi TaxID=227884 RepID=A0A914QDF5_9BILA